MFGYSEVKGERRVVRGDGYITKGAAVASDIVTTVPCRVELKSR